MKVTENAEQTPTQRPISQVGLIASGSVENNDGAVPPMCPRYTSGVSGSVESNDGEQRAYVKKNHLPNGWLECASTGDLIEAPHHGSGFLPIKVPLANKFSDPVSCSTPLDQDNQFRPQDLLDMYSDVGLVVDLTFTYRYYNGKEEFESRGVEYLKIMTQGAGQPPKRQDLDHFIRKVKEFWRAQPNKVVAVHCTHGINRTGFFIVTFLAEECGVSVGAALERFALARSPGIWDRDYIDKLCLTYSAPVPPQASIPQAPPWCREHRQRNQERGQHARGPASDLQRPQPAGGYGPDGGMRYHDVQNGGWDARAGWEGAGREHGGHGREERSWDPMKRGRAEGSRHPSERDQAPYASYESRHSHGQHDALYSANGWSGHAGWQGRERDVAWDMRGPAPMGRNGMQGSYGGYGPPPDYCRAHPASASNSSHDQWRYRGGAYPDRGPGSHVQVPYMHSYGVHRDGSTSDPYWRQHADAGSHGYASSEARSDWGRDFRGWSGDSSRREPPRAEKRHRGW